MIKRIIPICLTVVLILSVFSTMLSANEVPSDEINASNYLNSYAATLYSEGITGQLELSYQVYAKNYMTSVGVYKIVVRNSNGTIYKTIWGSTANGLLASNAWYHCDDYTITGLVSGNTYYCSVTVIAENSSGGDTRTVTTSLVTCP